MALSTLNPPVSALEDLIILTLRPAKNKIGPRLTRNIRRDILLLRDFNNYDGNEIEYIYVLEGMGRSRSTMVDQCAEVCRFYQNREHAQAYPLRQAC
jgi:hypothetical protein